MIPLSRAIRLGGIQGDDPLQRAVKAIGFDLSMASRESAKVMELHALHTAFPHIGQTVRSWPKLAEQAEKLNLVDEPRRYQNTYRREIHCSLYKLITTLHDRHAWSNSEIADLLESARL